MARRVSGLVGYQDPGTLNVKIYNMMRHKNPKLNPN